MSVLTVIRTRCKTCPHSYDPRELLGGLCSNCLALRCEKVTGFPEMVAKYKCVECGAACLAHAYMYWDTLANTFAYLCIPCADKAIALSSQYRGTEFGHIHKV